MGWFTEQIKERKKKDNDLLNEAFDELNSAITGRSYRTQEYDNEKAMQSALDEVLQFYHCEQVEVPGNITDFEEKLEYTLHPHGIMWREVVLEQGWYKDAIGSMIGRLKEDGAFVALIPNKFMGYHFIDRRTGQLVKLNKQTEKLLEQDGVCFYHGFPQREIGVRDLVTYMLRMISPATYMFLIIASLIVTLIGLLTPRITYLIYSDVLDSKSLQALIAITVFSISVGISTAMFTAVRDMISERVNTQLKVNVQAAAMARIVALPPDFFRGYSAGELTSKMESISMICSSIVTGIFSVGVTSIFSIIYIFQIFKYAKGLVVPSLIITVLTIGHTVLVTVMQMKISEQKMNSSAKLDGMTFGLISGIQKIKLSGSEKRALSKWVRMFSHKMRLTYRLPFVLLYSKNISAAITLIGQIVLYYLAVQTHVNVAEYNAFNSAYGMVSGAFMALVGIAVSIAEIRPTLRSAEPIMKAVPENNEKKKMMNSFVGNIEFNHVRFRYTEHTPYIINNLSLKIKKGQYVAIVGKSGCGKSTLVRLMLGFEKPNRGAIYYDNRDIATLDLKVLRRSIGTVMQDGKLFTGSIFDNITIASPTSTMEDAWEAAELVGLADDIREMPMGMHTMITEGSGGISGGQKQRLMIARAIVHNPKILIFDEATSALDNITQKHISDSLSQLKCTRIVIAHRLSTIRQCDRIIYIEDGVIAEDGTYEELIALNGKFAELVERQRLL